HAHSGNGILRHAHGDDFEGMNNISGTDVADDRLVHDDVDVVIDLNVVFAAGIGGIDAKNVGGTDQLHVLFSKFAIFAGVSSIPIELLGDNLNNCRLAFCREI